MSQHSRAIKIVIDVIQGVLRPLNPGERERVLAAIGARAATERGDLRGRVEGALRATDNNISQAAVALGISRRCIQNYMREFGLEKGRAGRKAKFVPSKKLKIPPKQQI